MTSSENHLTSLISEQFKGSLEDRECNFYVEDSQVFYYQMLPLFRNDSSVSLLLQCRRTTKNISHGSPCLLPSRLHETFHLLLEHHALLISMTEPPFQRQSRSSAKCTESLEQSKRREQSKRLPKFTAYLTTD